MTIICAVCKKEQIPGDNTRSFHKFPRDDELKQKWMQLTGVSSVKKNSKVCSDHFDISSFHDTDGYTRIRRLLSNAVPHMMANIKVSNITNDIVGYVNTVEEDKITVDQKNSKINSSLTIEDSCDLSNSSSEGNESSSPSIDKDREEKQSSDEMNIESRDFNISTDLDIEEYSCDSSNFSSEADETSSIADDSTTEVEIEKNDNENVTLNESSIFKRKQKIDVGHIPSTKKFRFMDGYQPTHVSRQDFVSDDAWQRFLKLMTYKIRQLHASRVKSIRREKKIGDIQKLVKSLLRDPVLDSIGRKKTQN